MDIKEIALRIGEEADDYADAKLQSKGEFHPDWHTVRDEYFTEALIAELAKQNEPVYAFRRKGLDDFCTCDKRRFDELSQKTTLFEVRVFYHIPPSVESLQSRIAELDSQLAEAKKDAERYRWLRDTLTSAVGGGVRVNDAALVYEESEPCEAVQVYWYPDTPVGFYESKADSLDEAIDAAIARVKGEQ